MLAEILTRFIVGGVVVSVFAALADLLKPKSFAGLFGAAPSVALATLALTVATDGKKYVAIEAHAMIGGAVAFVAYALVVAFLLARGKWPALPVTLLSLSVWFAAAFGLWFLFLR